MHLEYNVKNQSKVKNILYLLFLLSLTNEIFLSAQLLCFNEKSGTVKALTRGRACPPGSSLLRLGVDNIRDLSITRQKLANRSVTEDKIAYGAIKSEHILGEAIEGNHIKDMTIGSQKLNIDIIDNLPYVVYRGKTTSELSSFNVEYLYPFGKTDPSLNHDTIRNFEECMKFVMHVQITQAPGAGKKRLFYLNEGSGDLAPQQPCEIYDDYTGCSTGLISLDPEARSHPDHIQIRSEPVGNPAPAKVEWSIICK